MTDYRTANFEIDGVTVLRKWSGRTVVAGFAAALVACGVLGAVAGRIDPEIGRVLATSAPLGLGVVMVLALLAARWRRAKKGNTSRVAVGINGLEIDRQHVAGMLDVRSGVVSPTKKGVEVRIERRNGPPVELLVPSLEKGRALLDALNVGAAHTTLTRKIASPVVRPRIQFGLSGLLPLMAILAAFGWLPPGFVALGFLLLVVTIYVLSLIKTKVTVGADGIWIRWLGKGTFIRLEDIASVERIARQRFGFGGARLRVHETSGKYHEVLVAQRGNNLFEPYDANAELNLIAERIDEARAVRSDQQSVATEALVRGPELSQHAARLAAIREALKQARSGLKRDEPSEAARERVTEGLWRVVEDSAAGIIRRAAAVAELAARLGSQQRERLVEAVQAQGSSNVRVALESAVGGDDEATANALVRAEAETGVETVAQPFRSAGVREGDEANDVRRGQR